jgi:hypothetical protein
MPKPVGWRRQPARHALAARGIKTGVASNRFTILEGKRGSVDEITRIMRDGTRYDEDYPEEAMRRYLNQFIDPWKEGSLEFYRYEGRGYQIWTSPDGMKKAILASNELYSDSTSGFASMSTDVMIRHLTDAAEELTKHGDFAKLMPTYGMMNKEEMMRELTQYRAMTEDQIYEQVDAEHKRRNKG